MHMDALADEKADPLEVTNVVKVLRRLLRSLSLDFWWESIAANKMFPKQLLAPRYLWLGTSP